MTPARFDLLHVIHSQVRALGNHVTRRSIAMRDLRAQLGLAKPTVSKAVSRLVELGLVEKKREEYDRRVVTVRLTAEGLARIRRAYSVIFTGRAISRHFRAFVRDRLPRAQRRRSAPYHIDEALDVRWWDLVELGRHFGNSADYVYEFRYCPDH